MVPFGCKTLSLLLGRQIHSLQPQHAIQPARSSWRSTGLRQRLSHHCVWIHAGPTRWSVRPTCLALSCPLHNATSPLTGLLSFPAGEALLESHTSIDFVYCSPSLRCVQTAQHILQGGTTSSLTLSKSPGSIWIQLLFVPSLMRNSCRIFHICYGCETRMD